MKKHKSGLSIFIRILLSSFIFTAAMCCLLLSCDKENDNEIKDGNDDSDNVIIDEKYTIIYPSEHKQSVRETAMYLKISLDENGYTVNAVEESDDKESDIESDYEVLIGATSRSETATAKDKLGNGNYNYIITVVGKKLVIYSEDDSYYKYALSYLKDNCIIDGKYVFAKDYTYIGETLTSFVTEETIDGYTTIDATFTPGNSGCNIGIFVGKSNDVAMFGYSGYCLLLNKDTFTVYSLTNKLTERASRKIPSIRKGVSVSIRLVINKTSLYAYYLDDAEGVTPWPEISLVINNLDGGKAGYVNFTGYNMETNAFKITSDKSITTQSATYSNTVMDKFADPDVLLYNGLYYLYGTGGSGYSVYTSNDLVNWKYKSVVAKPSLWGETVNYWAPDIEYINGKFYMVVSCNEKLGLAVSDSPTGPFTEHSKTILYNKSIDGHFFVDDDGTVYLYFVSWRSDYGIYGVKLDSNLNPIASTEKRVISVTDSWEKNQGNITEGPYMLKHNGTYYLTYSGSHYISPAYAVGYATSDSPLGIYKKYSYNPIMIGNTQISGVGHHCITTTPDGSEMVIVYHCHNNVTTVQQRKICVDRIRFAPVKGSIDRLEVFGPTTTPEPVFVKK